MGEHHSMDQMSPALLAALKADKDDLRKEKLVAESPNFGATGKFPDGALDKSDEGEISFGVTSHRGKVIINFGKPVAWLGMNASQAAALAAVLIRHATNCRDIGGPQEQSDATAKEHA